jgi:arylsulfatase
MVIERRLNMKALFKMIIVLCGVALVIPFSSFAAQFDAPYLVLEKKNKDKWGAEDKQISEKLAALEKRFGKKPNIIMVLTDDIGWGVLGAYGGGKVVGAPTPNLDEMARDGMKFLSAYSEPSCTPTRLALLTGRQPHRTGVNVVLWPGQKQGLVKDEVGQVARGRCLR